MKITLISLHPEILSIGPRALSAALKKAGFKVDLIFIPTEFIWSSKGSNRSFFRDKDSREFMENLISVCKNSGLIGISLVAHSFVQAIAITQGLKTRLSVPVIWGGPQPTAQPEICLKYADMVCLGDGDEAIVDVANMIQSNNLNIKIPNIVTQGGNEIICYDVRPLVQDLDNLPVPDCDIMGQFIVSENKLMKLDESLLNKYAVARTVGDKYGVTYLVATSRGCPHNCTYCSNDMWRRLYPGQQYVRRRSPSSVCDEMEIAIKKIPSIISVFFVDDNFAAINIKKMEEFFSIYSKRIGLPFSCTVSPVFATQDRVDILIENGVFRLSTGIQSASQRTLDFYERKISIPSSRQAIKIMEKNANRLMSPKIVTYHYIVDNPYESAQDIIDTFYFILENHPRRNSVIMLSLLPFPGTEIYRKMKEDGLIIDENKQIFQFDYGCLQPGFAKYWYGLYLGGFPAAFLKVLLKPWIVNAVNNKRLQLLWGVFFKLLELICKIFFKIKNTIFFEKV
ncbi:MAG: B12-binding domain-containing radical SAM protein [Candidatus Omnitrophica bacterium]|nr:B12-binding domain-containing radical SAM protein [Candidatus Omnitrophota bacterium]